MEILTDSIIFLHGPSGSGKGEVQRKLAEKYSREGYSVIYASSGALFRAALLKPEIARQMKQGQYLDTLGAIIPGLQHIYEHYLRKYVETDGKAVLILDGLIRRGEFFNKKGDKIPSQIEQIAAAFDEVNRRLVIEDSRFADLLGYKPEDPEAMLKEQVKESVVCSRHILVDINPEDAEEQMRRRANVELQSITAQLNDKILRGEMGVDIINPVLMDLQRLAAIVNGGVKRDGDKYMYIPKMEWDSNIPREYFPALAEQTIAVQQDLARIIGLDSSSSIASSLESLGISTEIREDDISPIGRWTRVGNYVEVHESPEGRTYSPGFAAKALIDGLGFRFESNGRFTPEVQTSNRTVIQNGRSRGISLEGFRTTCEFIGGRLYNESSIARERSLAGQEGKLLRKEEQP